MSDIILGVVMINIILGTVTSDVILGIAIPAAVFAFSYYMTHLLYRHFADQSDPPKDEADQADSPQYKADQTDSPE
jgi:hypothetical protein